MDQERLGKSKEKVEPVKEGTCNAMKFAELHQLSKTQMNQTKDKIHFQDTYNIIKYSDLQKNLKAGVVEAKEINGRGQEDIYNAITFSEMRNDTMSEYRELKKTPREFKNKSIIS